MLHETKTQQMAKSKRRKVPVFRLYLRKGAKIEIVQNHPRIKQIVFNELVLAVKEGIDRKKDEIDLFHAGDTGLSLELSKNEWKQSLTSALEYFTVEEDYDRCCEVRDLIKQLN